MMNIKLQRPVVYKSFDCEIKADSTTRKVSGYLNAFGVKDSDGDVIVKGAFAKSISERGPQSATRRKIAYLYQHDMTRPIGRFTTLAEDSTGLYFEAELDNITLANDVLEQYKSGTLNQHSIGFRYIFDKMEYDEDSQSFIIKEVDLFEGSVVTLGANENTPFTGMKSADKEAALNQLYRDFEQTVKHFPHEDSFRMRQIISKYISLFEDGQPAKATPKAEEPSIDWNTITNHFKN